jgi:hypothetical protein
MSVKNFSDTIGNQTRDVPVCSAGPQPTAPPRAHIYMVHFKKVFLCLLKVPRHKNIWRSGGIAPGILHVSTAQHTHRQKSIRNL